MVRITMLMLAAATLCCFLVGTSIAADDSPPPASGPSTDVTPAAAPSVDPYESAAAPAPATDNPAHLVGGPYGWRLPPNESFYEAWANDRTVAVGDKLYFAYTPGHGNVAVVSKEDYEKCTNRDTKFIYVLGPTTVPLPKAGDYYFINTIGKHCRGGQKLHITAKEGVEGDNGGRKWDGKILLEEKKGSSGPKKLSAAPAPAPAKATATPTPAPAPAKAAAAAIHNVGIASGLFTVLFSLFV